MIRNYCHQLLIFVIIICSISCKTELNTTKIDSKSKFSFPDDWLGKWSGDLEIFKDGIITQKIPMQLVNKRTHHPDTLQWSIIYGNDTIKGLREYYLIIDSTEDNHYVVDERNSILLDGYVFDNAYFTSFKVMNNNLLSIYRLKSDSELLFEIIFNSNTPKSKSGNEVIKGDSIPEVWSFEISTYQRALLHRSIN